MRLAAPLFPSLSLNSYLARLSPQAALSVLLICERTELVTANQQESGTNVI